MNKISFNWPTFLTRYHIQFNSRGPNTPTGAVSIHCPLCGQADPSDHMVLWPNGAWRCWRNHEHGGGHPARLIQILIGCSYTEAQRLVGSAPTPGAAEFAAVATMFTPTTAAPVAARKLALPPEFKPFSGRWGCEPFAIYLQNRGFGHDPTLLHQTYGLHYAPTGPFKGRIIIPMIYKGELISWTGRSIYPAEGVRYKSLTTNAEAATRAGLEPALAPINHYLLWWDWLRTVSAADLVLVEGPLDALKVNLLGNGEVAATCWMGSEPTRQQIDLIHRLAPTFSRCWIISDADMPHKAYRIADSLRPLLFTVAKLPHGVEDPAELRTRAQLHACLR